MPLYGIEMNKYLLILLFPLVVMASPPSSCDDTIFIQSGDLPITIDTSNACYGLNGDISTSDTAITFTGTDILFDMGGYTLTFANATDIHNSWGIKFSGNGTSTCKNIKLYNGSIVLGGSGLPDSNTCVMLDGSGAGSKITFDSVYFYVWGNNGHCLNQGVGSDTDHWDWLFHHCRFGSGVDGFYNRMHQDGNIMRMNQDLLQDVDSADITSLGETFSYNVKFDSCVVDSCPAGMGLSGVLLVHACSVMVDMRNEYWDSVAVTDESWKGLANSAAIGTNHAGKGSIIDSNVVIAGSNYEGCDEGIIIQVGQASEENPILVFDNKMDIRAGYDPYYEWGLWAKGIKMRYGNAWVKVYNNDITVHIGDADSGYGKNCAGISYITGDSLDWGWGDSHLPDSNIWIYGNTIETVPHPIGGVSDIPWDGMRGVFISSGKGLDSAEYDWEGANINWYGNTIKTYGWVYNIGGGDGSATGVLIKEDTVNHQPSITGPDHDVYAVYSDAGSEPAPTQHGDLNFALDQYYLNGSETNIQVGSRANLLSIGLKKTCSITVTNDGSPVEGITVTATSAYGTTFSDETNGNGIANPIVIYKQWFDDIPDSTSYNDYVFSITEDDITDTITVDWETYEGTITGSWSGESSTAANKVIIIIGQ